MALSSFIVMDVTSFYSYDLPIAPAYFREAFCISGDQWIVATVSKVTDNNN